MTTEDYSDYSKRGNGGQKDGWVWSDSRCDTTLVFQSSAQTGHFQCGTSFSKLLLPVL
jgi:hypothetical protein